MRLGDLATLKLEEKAGNVKVCYENGYPHRVDGPACIWSNGSKEWYKHGERHRTDGPATIYADGLIDWWVDGQRITTYKDYQHLTGCSCEDTVEYTLKYGNMLINRTSIL